MGTYSLAADMWSIGVILYVLLSGSYPFSDDDRDRKIATASFSFQNRKVWGTVSAEAKNLIRQLLVVNPDKRLTAKQALENVWFTGTTVCMAQVDSKMPSSASSSSTTVLSLPPPELMQVSESQPPPHPPTPKGGRKAKGGTAKTKAAGAVKNPNMAALFHGSSATNSAQAAPTAGRSTRSSSRKGDGKINDRDAMPPPKGKPSPAKQKRSGAMDKWLSPPVPMEIPVDEDRQQSDSARELLPAEVAKPEKENLNVSEEALEQRKRSRSAAKENSVGGGKRAKPLLVQEQQQEQQQQQEQVGAASTCGENQPNPLAERFAMSS